MPLAAPSTQHRLVATDLDFSTSASARDRSPPTTTRADDIATRHRGRARSVLAPLRGPQQFDASPVRSYRPMALDHAPPVGPHAAPERRRRDHGVSRQRDAPQARRLRRLASVLLPREQRHRRRTIATRARFETHDVATRARRPDEFEVTRPLRIRAPLRQLARFWLGPLLGRKRGVETLARLRLQLVKFFSVWMPTDVPD